MIIIVFLAYIVMFPLILINGILSWFKEHIALVYMVLIIPSILLTLPLAFIYLVIYSILESLNYSDIDSMESPEKLMKF